MLQGMIARIRVPGLLHRLRESAWGTRDFFELRCDLAQALPPIRQAKIPIVMEPVDPRTFRGFRDELKKIDSPGYLDVILRVWYCRAGAETLYVGRDGVSPAYAQWLVSRDQQQRIPRFMRRCFPAPIEGEMLVEGAYTFVDYRRLGLMRDGMAQLIRFASETDASAVVTYVAVDNIPSLRGCADVGFVPHRLRVSTRRVLRRTQYRPLGEADAALWGAATATVGSNASAVAGSTRST